jgi:alpha-amylase
MKKINFLFAVHDHQPLGNFEHVFRDCYANGYLPFFEELLKFPNVRISVHISGPLFDWILKNGNALLEILNTLKARKQIEFLGSGYYEPILSSIPEEDQIGQLNLMSDFIKEKFDEDIKGIWLTERIWTPNIPKVLNKANISYTILDDTHFRYAGCLEPTITGIYITEYEGYPLYLFPIDKKLRYMIPFAKVSEFVTYLKELKNNNNSEILLTYADDGEKFGVWPGTHEWVYKKGWLHDFFASITDNLDWINMPTFSEITKTKPEAKRIYIPVSSYAEMLEWALPTDTEIKYHRFIEKLKEINLYEDNMSFVRGGFWNNFLTKYEEANLMHKKMLYVSNKIRNSKYARDKEVTIPLYKGQCNCPYWHGLFGGLYLNYLRSENYRNLINAENELDKKLNNTNAKYEIYDYDKDGKEEVLLSNSTCNLYIKPSYGGSVFEIDYRPKSFNILNVLSRKKEYYHEKIFKKDIKEENQPKSIHDIVNVKEPISNDDVCYDTYNKFSFLDHFIKEDDLENFRKSNYTELGDFLIGSYDLLGVNKVNNEIKVDLTKKGFIKQIQTNISKTYNLCENKTKLYYKIELSQKIKEENILFCVELNLTLLAGHSPDRFILVDENKSSLSEINHDKNISNVRLIDEYNKFSIVISATNTNLYKFPINTISQSEGGIEKTYQGTSLLFYWNLEKDKIIYEKELIMQIFSC